MTNKQSFYSAVLLMLVGAIIARVRAAYENAVPMGYQDESGFHLGEGLDSDDRNVPPMV